MGFLIHLIFQTLKISILALLYSYLFNFITKKIDHHLLKKYVNRSKLMISIFIILFCWQFTYWGNHGLGDFSRIPLGDDKEIKQIDINSFIELKENYPIYIDSFAISNEHFYGKISDFGNQSDEKLIVWNLSDNTIDSSSLGEKDISIPKDLDFISFRDAYKNYWNGWRFWFLP